MSWKLKKKLQGLLDDEQGAIVKDPGGKTSVALVYPNTYRVGMSNLAVHSLYKILNDHPGIVCERAFLPERADAEEYRRTGTQLMSLESQRPLRAFDVIAFTVSFENDLLNIIPLLELAKIPHRAGERTDEHPLVIAGGAAITLNPEPLTRIADMCIAGEFEACDGIIDVLLQGRRALTSDIPPWVVTQAGDVRSAAPAGARYYADLDNSLTQTVIHTPHAEFGNMHLIEVMRGCGRGCSFCAVPGIYGSPRLRSYEAIARMIDEGFEHRTTMGLVGTDILAHPRFADIAHNILDRGGRFSLSSIRAERITPEIAELLARAGMRSVSLGIEAATELLRSNIGKRLTDERCLSTITELARAGITSVRLYFMIGLPFETDADVDAIMPFARAALDAVRAYAPRTARSTAVECTITPFVPKLLTPFANEQFAGVDRINALQKKLKKAAGKKRDIKLSFDSAQQAAVEAYLAKAGPEALFFLEEAHRTSPRAALKTITA